MYWFFIVALACYEVAWKPWQIAMIVKKIWWVHKDSGIMCDNSLPDLSCLGQPLAASVAMYLGQIKAGGIDCL